MSVSSIPGKLSREVLRKLRLVRTYFISFMFPIVHPVAQRSLHQATDAESKDDREIVCSEVFADVTGSLDNHALGEGVLLPKVR